MDNEKESQKKNVCPRCSWDISNPQANYCPLCGMDIYSEKGNTISVESPNQPLNKAPQPISRNWPVKGQKAGFWIRFGAFWMDIMIILLLSMFFGSLVYSTALGDKLFPNAEKISLFFILLFVFYHGLSLGAFKTTIGKRFFGLEVIPQESSGRYGYSEAFLRASSYFASMISFFIGFLWIIKDKNKQTLHDKIARTFVIKIREVPLIKKSTILVLMTFFILILIALQFNITWVYRSAFNPGQSLGFSRGREVVSVLVTQSEIKNGVYKKVETLTGPYVIKIPSSTCDGDIFKVNRLEENGGVFYIRILIVEAI